MKNPHRRKSGIKDTGARYSAALGEEASKPKSTVHETEQTW